MKILDHRQIQQKIKRLAFEILERNYGEEEIILAGINNNGMTFAELLLAELRAISSIRFTLTRLRLNPAAPAQHPIQLEMPVAQLDHKVVIIVDDVANTGRTIFYAIKPILEVVPKKVEVAVLVDRTHKSFPIRVDYFGLSLATTLLQNIKVRIREVQEWAVNLE
ncbi:MAG: phosphoribosyltransferase family protein [Saprospiraceae bacterium]